MDGKITFDFKALLPQIEPLFALFSGDMTSEGISSLFIAILLLLFVCFLIWVLCAGFLSRRSIVFFRELLRGLTPDSLIDKRQDLKQRAKQGNRRLSELWAEFDETLVVSEGEKRIQNTFDAAHFFNAHTLGRGITENRLLAAVPGFLTAIGVVGTFTGLFLGLSNVNPEDVASITRLIQGASIAFKTSVWGVSLSFIFNLIEKGVEQYVRYNITTLQDNIDALFPRLSPEQTLVHVHEETRQAAITLDGLSERIGNKMQETVSQVAQNVQTAVIEGIQQVLQPSLESLAQASNDLAERQARGGAEVLENLIHQFSAGLKGQGEQQREMMEATTAEVKTAIGQWGGSIARFMEALEGLNQHMNAREQTRTEAFEERFQTSQDALTQHVDQLQQQMTGLLTDHASQMQAQTQVHLNEWTKQAGQASNMMETAVEQFSAGLKGQGEQQREMMEATTAEVKTAIGQWSGSMARFMEALEGLNQHMEAREQTRAEAFDERFQTSQDALTRHVDQLQQQITGLLTDHASQMQAQTRAHLNEWTKQAGQASNMMETAVEQFSVSLKGQGEQQREMMEATTAEVKTAIGQWGGSMAHFMDALETMNQRMDARENARAESFSGHLQASQTVLQQSQKLYEQVATVTEGLRTSASAMRTGSELLNSASDGLRSLSEGLRSGVNQLDQTLGRMLEQTRRLSEENETTGRNINQVISVIASLKDVFSGAADKIVEASTASRQQTDQLIQHQQQLVKALQDHIDQLQQQVAQLLTDYADRVQTQTQDRLNEWTKQTQQYTSAMEAAVESIASTVEEMDGKIGIRR